ncbi:hypothetical protein [Pseudoxanthomonas sp. PXM02]|uniref:hypothetical protein n=1 Tax=Pseudoxanthomonas sp. PXM02 TaxID=2769294 RepID=UPI001CE13DF8|nr:hypothetical protein [Pseudoxanthomonas sp. PXM02]
MPHEPLTPEERALAQSLSRLGPHGGPSPDLDARILGAARAAVQPSTATTEQVRPARRRWPLGMGVAASMLLAAGIAWQLRPMHEMPIASEAPMDAERSAGVDAEPQAADAAAAAMPIADVPPPAAIAVEEAPTPMAAKISPPPAVAQTPPTPGPARQNAEAAARQEPAPKRGPLALIPVPASPPAPPAPEPAPQAFPAEADSYSYSAPAPAATAASEAALREQVQQRIGAQQEQEQRARQVEYRREAAAEAAAKAEDNRTLDTIAVTGNRVKSRERRSKAQDVVSAPAPAPAMAPPPPPPPAASAGSVQPSAARNALRRTDLQVPVDADTRLTPDEWLERIRLRRDLGDDANALRSLQLFVQEHPFQRVPDDLRPLLGNP